MRKLYLKMTSKLMDFLNQPHKVLIYGLILSFLSLAMDGSLLSWWRLTRGKEEIHRQINHYNAQSSLIDNKIQQALQPEFLKKLAIEQFELAEKDELIFVFTQEEPLEEPQKSEK